MFHALDLGISVDAFWEMTPRAICLLVQEMARNTGSANASVKGAGGPASPRVVHLNYIPRP